MSLIAIGDKNRTIATTNSNVHSSRSHAIVTLTVCQRVREAPMDGLPTSALKNVVSRVHLVDLAGSERVTLSGAAGVRLKEANNINKSLSVLGDVIKCLGDSKFKRGNHIPYRNSTLTLILKDSLGGNSHTVMLTNVSPSSYDYEETVSTLKYADRAKRVRMRVDANVTSGLLATDQSAVDLVPLLQAEVNKLKEMLRAQQREQTMVGPAIINQEEVVKKMQLRVAELEKQLADRESLIQSLELMRLEGGAARAEVYSSAVSPGAVARSVVKKRSNVSTSRSTPVMVLPDEPIDTGMPRLVNLNQDPLFSECLVYYVPAGQILAGSNEEIVDILVSGPDVLPRHCVIHNDSENIWVEPLQDAAVYLNGELIPPRTRVKVNRVLNHCDRIAFGRFHLFRFEAKNKEGGRQSLDRAAVNANVPSWDFAQQELMLKINNPPPPTEPPLPSVKTDRVVVKEDAVRREVSPPPASSSATPLVDVRGNGSVDVRATLPLTASVPAVPPAVDTSKQAVPERRNSVLDSQYEEIFSRARKQLEKFSNPAPTTTSAAAAYSSGDSSSFDFKDAKSPFQRAGQIAEPMHKNIKAVPREDAKPVTAKDSTVVVPVAFEKEALALQAELAQMQKTLQERMSRYSVISSQSKP